MIEQETPLGKSREKLQRTKIKHIKVLIESGHKIDAIKYTRNNTGWGLKESKDYVDMIQEEMKNGRK